MKKQIALALAMIVVVAVAIGWVRYKRIDPQVDSLVVVDSSIGLFGRERMPAEEHPGDVPYDLAHWIEATLWRNGMLESHRDSFLTTTSYARTRLWVDSSGAKPLWTVDFSGLDVSALGEDSAYGQRLISDDFGVALRLDGTRLCRVEERTLSIPGWSFSGEDHLRCGAEDGQKLVRRWFVDRFGREPGKSELSQENGTLMLDVSCRSQDNLGGLGRLRSVAFGRIRFAGCTLASDEVLQLAEVAVDRLELIDTKAEVLPLFDARVAERLTIQGGGIEWVDVPLACPAGRSSCEYKDKVLPGRLSVEIKDVALCSPTETVELRRLGAKLENLRCQDIPMAMLERQDSLEAKWTRLRGDDVAKILATNYDTIPLEDRPRFDELKKTWEMAVAADFQSDCGDDSYPKQYTTRTTRGGKGRVEDQYFEGDAIQIEFKGQKIHAGMTREALIAVLGRPSVDRDGFLAWSVMGGCDLDPVNLRAHFDAQGKLDAWFDRVESGCDDC